MDKKKREFIANDERHFLDLTPEEQRDRNEYELRELANYYGGWDELRAFIKTLEDADDETAFDNYMEERYSIDGIAAHNAANAPRTKDSYIDGAR